MEFKAVLEVGAAIIASLGSASALILGISKYFGKIWAEKILEKDRAHYQSELEGLKSKYAQNLSIQETSQNFFGTIHHSAHERRLRALEGVWEAYLQFRWAIPSTLSIIDAFDLSDHDNFLKSDPGVLTQTQFYEKLKEVSYVESHRPFLNERIWAIFASFRASVGRAIYLYIDKSLTSASPWYYDPWILKMLKATFSPEDFKSFSALKRGQMVEVLKIFEKNILMEMGTVISGEMSSDATLAQSKKILEIVAGSPTPIADSSPTI